MSVFIPQSPRRSSHHKHLHRVHPATSKLIWGRVALVQSGLCAWGWKSKPDKRVTTREVGNEKDWIATVNGTSLMLSLMRAGSAVEYIKPHSERSESLLILPSMLNWLLLCLENKHVWDDEWQEQCSAQRTLEKKCYVASGVDSWGRMWCHFAGIRVCWDRQRRCPNTEGVLPIMVHARNTLCVIW